MIPPNSVRSSSLPLTAFSTSHNILVTRMVNDVVSIDRPISLSPNRRRHPDDLYFNFPKLLRHLRRRRLYDLRGFGICLKNTSKAWKTIEIINGPNQANGESFPAAAAAAPERCRRGRRERQTAERVLLDLPFPTGLSREYGQELESLPKGGPSFKSLQ
ncbi:hypothetical protein LINPERPRIM_LOCUS18534 [Linum perenne]